MIDNDFNPLTTLDHYYDKQDIYTRECLLALKAMIMSVSPKIVPMRKYQIPFFCYGDFNIVFLWVHQKKIIVGFVEDKKSFTKYQISRSKDRVMTMEINPMEDIPIDTVKNNIKKLIERYNSFLAST
ncbi:DUF1801 domain-containing protein [Parabacteroides sp. Marseille-P3160]|uniref:DUF1801 domain-containing protein n=1 Tax=Parabacteroides sp. Marseille-P3160 TaxID=1917887 RepID=UPI0011188931|nr:DUF1801 domain-containing protein [Parabacteroides sp. Marseille-P3160]